MVCIPDSELIKIAVKDNGEQLVDIAIECPNIRINPPEYLANGDDEAVKSIGKVREEVAKRLNLAASFLPENLKLLVRCGFRPLSVQKVLWEKEVLRVKTSNPDWTDDQIKEEANRWVAPLDIVPPHSTGGAVDLTLIDLEGKELDMGTVIGGFDEASVTDWADLPLEVLANRKILSDIMTKAGFVNYPVEWWHWTYGDRYWAAYLKKPFSIYKSL